MDMFNNIVCEYKSFPQVKAIAIGGSSAAGTSDKASDIDTYVFTTKAISLEKREEIAKKYSSNYEVGCEYFGSGDEYMVDKLNQQMDIMYWDKGWFESTVSNIWEKCYPSNGYSTCFLYTLKNLRILHDTDNWLQSLKEKLNGEYPQQLQENIIKRNIMLLKDKPFASYYEQIEKALNRDDKNSINHRIAAFMASYFDIIFAANKMLHPGEKRLVKFVKDNCKLVPEMFEENINKLFKQPNNETLKILDNMVNNLRKII